MIWILLGEGNTGIHFKKNAPENAIRLTLRPFPTNRPLPYLAPDEVSPGVAQSCS